MKTHKRKPLLNAILLHYRHILVYILPLRVNIPKKFLKSDDAGYLVHRWEHRPRNKTTQLLTWVLPFTSANPRTAFERIWRAEVTLAWPTSRHSEDQTGCFMWRFFGIYKQGYKIVSLDWMERTHYIKEPKSDTQRQKKKKRNRWFLWVHPYFFPFISLHFEVISQHYKQEIRYFHSSWPEIFLLWKEKYFKNVERCCPTTQGKCQFSFLDSSSTY